MTWWTMVVLSVLLVEEYHFQIFLRKYVRFLKATLLYVYPNCVHVLSG